jgi:hypothetical protein
LASSWPPKLEADRASLKEMGPVKVRIEIEAP